MSYIIPVEVAQGTNSSYKKSVRAASTANVTLAGTLTALDTVSLNDGDSVLLKDQSTASENGVYVWSSGTQLLTRSEDFQTANVSSALLIAVQEGTQATTLWQLSTPNPITVGTTGLSFVEAGGSGEDLATTLALGNTTGANNIEISSGQFLEGAPNAALNIRTQQSGTDGFNAHVSIAAAASDVGTGSPGGNVTITAGDGDEGAGSVSITAGSCEVEDAGSASLTGGTGGTGFSGGNSSVVGGNGNASGGAGGQARLWGGNGGTTSGNGGISSVRGGTGGGTSGAGGNVQVTGGTGGAPDGNGGDVRLIGGAPSGGGAPGEVVSESDHRIQTQLTLDSTGAASTGAGEGALSVNASGELDYTRPSTASVVTVSATDPIYVPLAPRDSVDGGTADKVVGWIQLNMNDWTRRSTWTFEAVMRINDVARTGTLYIQDITNNQLISTLTLTGTTDITAVSVVLTTGGGAGELKFADTLYEIHLTMDGGNGADTTSLGNAYLKMTE